MNPQMETLIMLQDLDLMIKEMSDKKTANQMNRIGFKLNAMGNLEQARKELAGNIDLDLLATYRRLMGRYQRAIVPAKKNTCLGCFLKQPTKFSGEDSAMVHNCSNCKRFIYFI